MKYNTIEDDLRKKIIRGDYEIGQALESDDELCKMYQVSQLTLSRALTNLADKGYIKRIKGKGTFVKSLVSNESKKTLVHTGLGQDIKEQGMKPGVKLLEYRVANANEFPDVKRLLDVDDDDMFHYFVRLRTGDDMPLVYSVYYMPISRVPLLDVHMLNNGSIWEFLSEVGFSGVNEEDFDVEIFKAKGKIARALNVEDDHLLLLSHQVDRLEGKKPYAYIVTYYNSSKKFKYRYKLVQAIR